MKMIIREMILYYRSHKAENIVLVCQIAAFFILIGTFFAFTSETHYGKSNIERAYKDKAIYQLIDGYSDPDEFEAFRAEPNALNILKSYYNALNNADSFQYLSMFDQNIIVDDMNGAFPEELAVNNSRQLKRVDAFQINEQACEYFELDVIKGRTFQQGDFDENGAVLPVLMGSNYIDIFEVGDRLSATFYQKEVELEIIGFLRENTIVYFNGNSEFYLDQYMILPYINYNAPETEFDEWFQEVVYFAMINGYISISSGDTYTRDMMMELEAISEKTGFYNYVFIGSNPNIQQYRGLISILNENYNLILSLLILSFLINMVTIGLQIYMMQERRLHAMAIHYLNGATLQELMKQFVMEVLLAVGFAALAGWIVLVRLKISNAVIMLIILTIAVILTVGISLISISKLKNVELMLLLNQEDDLS